MTGAVRPLDRVAALRFAAPVFFHSVRWYFDAELGQSTLAGGPAGDWLSTAPTRTSP